MGGSTTLDNSGTHDSGTHDSGTHDSGTLDSGRLDQTSTNDDGGTLLDDSKEDVDQ